MSRTAILEERAKVCSIPIWVLLVSSNGKESSRLFRSCGEKRQIAVANHLRCTMMHNNVNLIRSNYGSSNTIGGTYWWDQSSEPSRIQQQTDGNRPGKIWSQQTRGMIPKKMGLYTQTWLLSGLQWMCYKGFIVYRINYALSFDGSLH